MKERRGIVLCQDKRAGVLRERVDGKCEFSYDAEYLARPDAHAISLTLPLRSEPYISDFVFPFFEGLLAEGNLKDLQCRMLKLDPNDVFGRVIKTTGGEVIGCVNVVEEQDDD